MFSKNAELIYLSDEQVLINIDKKYTNKELQLKDKLNNIKNLYKGYDEYILEKDEEINHDPHILLSYISSKFGKIEDASAIEEELENLFNDVYLVQYREVKEIRYDKDNLPYEYTKLITSVKKNHMNKIVTYKLKNQEE